MPHFGCILGDQMTNGMRALLLVLGSAVLGAAYFWTFMPRLSHPISCGLFRSCGWPAPWLQQYLLLALWRNNNKRAAAGLALALSIPNSVLAATFSRRTHED